MILPQPSGSEEEGLVHEVEVAAVSLPYLKIWGFSILSYTGPKETF